MKCCFPRVSVSELNIDTPLDLEGRIENGFEANLMEQVFNHIDAELAEFLAPVYPQPKQGLGLFVIELRSIDIQL